MLVGANHGAVDMMQTPVEFAFGVRLRLKVGQDAVPDPSATPAVEAGGKRLPRAVLLGEIPPGRTRSIEPQQAVDDLAMFLRRAATTRLLWWEQRPWALPLFVDRISSAHTSESTYLDDF
ncbi:MAG: hypothetical protein NVS4B2_31210 [Chloroflexota bacterium]